MASVTVWTRLEPHPREGSLQRSLQAQVRDPLWFLARQWQVGEFQGQDAGSPVQATMSVTSRPLTGYAPDGSGVAQTAYDPVLPLETHIERVPVTLNVRGCAQLGRWVETAIRAAVPPGAADTVIAALRDSYPIAATAPADAAEDPRGRAVRASLAGRVVDGVALAAAYATLQSGGTPDPPLPPAASTTGVPGALADLVTYRGSLYSEPDGDDAWRPRRLDYAATVTSTTTAPTAGSTPAGDSSAGDSAAGDSAAGDGAVGDSAAPDTLALVATDFPGGDLDWYSFSLAEPPADSEPPSPAPAPSPPAATVETFNFLPQHVTFRGMPSPHWWEFEDGVTDFGALTPDKTDLATLLVAEFALVFGNDWFVVPVPTGVGTLSAVDTLVVTDTFGIRTVIEPTERLATGSTGSASVDRWSMFALGDSPYRLMPPTSPAPIDGSPLEDVRFLRDDMAAMAWAVEHQVQGPLDMPVDAQQLSLDHDAAFAPPPLPEQVPGGPKQTYVLETAVPDNWIPMVAVTAPSGARFFRRGVLVRPGRGDITPSAHLLNPGEPMFVADEGIPREGTAVTRYFRRTRAQDGSVVTWLAHRSGPGRGTGWSGLAFDLVTPLPSPATAP